MYVGKKIQDSDYNWLLLQYLQQQDDALTAIHAGSDPTTAKVGRGGTVSRRPSKYMRCSSSLILDDDDESQSRSAWATSKGGIFKYKCKEEVD